MGMEGNFNQPIVPIEKTEDIKKNRQEFDQFIANGGMKALLDENGGEVVPKYTKSVGADYITEKLFELNRGDAVARLMVALKLDIKEVVPKIIDQGWEWPLIWEADKYKNTKPFQETIAEALIEKGKKNLVQENLSKFNALSEDFLTKNQLK